MEITYREALRLGLKNVLENEKLSFLIGEDVGAYGGAYGVSKEFLNDFGAGKIIDAPLSEVGFSGLAIGAALGGLKPIVEIMTINFTLLALDQIINSAATINFMSGGQFSIPVIFRMTSGGGRQLSAQHSNSFEGWFAHIPGLKILCPASIEDARFMLEFAMKENSPVLIIEHAQLLNTLGELNHLSEEYNPFKAHIIFEGSDLTLVTYGGMVPRCKAACQEIKKAGKTIELIDLRSIRPIDNDTIFNSIKKTHRLLVVDEGWKSGSLSAEISARVTEFCFYDLDGPVERLCKKEFPMPYSRHLEEMIIPQANDIVSKIEEMLK